MAQTNIPGTKTDWQVLRGYLNNMFTEIYTKLFESGKVLSDNNYTTAEKNKLAGISGTNTGDETASTIVTKIGDGSKIDSQYLPSYVDDVLEVADYASLPVTGEQGKIYVTIDNNTQYRWSGSDYVSISNPLSYASQAEAEAGTDNTKVMTALRVFQSIAAWLLGDLTGLIVNTAISASDTIKQALGKLQGQITNLLSIKTDKLIIANRQTASYTLVLSDADKLVEMNVGTANNLTVPPNSSVAFDIGTQIIISQYGAGQTTIVAGAGVTLRSDSGSLKISTQYVAVTLIKIATDEWYVLGGLTV